MAEWTRGRRRPACIALLGPLLAAGLALTLPRAAGAQPSAAGSPTPTTTEVVFGPHMHGPRITSIVSRPGALTVSFLPAADGTPARYYGIAARDPRTGATRSVVVPADVRTASIDHLDDGVDYAVSVGGLGVYFFGTQSEEVAARPRPDGPRVTVAGAVQGYQVTRTRNGVTASWTPPSTDGGSPIVAYVMTAVDRSTNKLAAWRTLATDVRSASLAPIPDALAYEVTVFAVTTVGFGSSAARIDLLGAVAPATPRAPTLSWATAWLSPGQYPDCSYRDQVPTAVVLFGAAEEHGVATTGYNAVVVQDGRIVGWAVAKADARSLGVRGFDWTRPVDVYVFASSAIGFGAPVAFSLERIPASTCPDPTAVS